MRSLKSDMWQSTDFEKFRPELISELEKKVICSAPRQQGIKRSTRQDITEQVLNELSEKYGTIIHAQGPGSLDDNYLSELNSNQLSHLKNSLQYDFPLELLLHMQRDQMVNFFVGTGKVAKNGWNEYFVHPEIRKIFSTAHIISGYMRTNAEDKKDITPYVFSNQRYFPKRYDDILADISIPYSAVGHFRSDGRINESGNMFDILQKYVRKKGKRNPKARRREASDHLRLKKNIHKKRGRTMFEVNLKSEFGEFFPVDAVRIYDKGVFVYECKSSPIGNGFLQGQETLQKAGQYIYYNFGIIPKLRLLTQFKEIEISMPPVNPVFEGELYFKF